MHAKFIANYIIEKAIEKKITLHHTALQPLLYYVQARSLVKRGEPAFKELIEKPEYGALIPVVYNNWKRFETNDLDKQDAKDVIEEEIVTVKRESDTLKINKVFKYNHEDIPKKVRLIIEELLDEYKELMAEEEVGKYRINTLLFDSIIAKPIFQKDLSEVQKKIRGERNESIFYTNDEIKGYFLAHPEELSLLSLKKSNHTTQKENKMKLYTWSLQKGKKLSIGTPQESDAATFDIDSVVLNKAFEEDGFVSYNSLNVEDGDIAKRQIYAYLMSEKGNEVAMREYKYTKAKDEFEQIKALYSSYVGTGKTEK